jgi:hypothetical protein
VPSVLPVGIGISQEYVHVSAYVAA